MFFPLWFRSSFFTVDLCSSVLLRVSTISFVLPEFCEEEEEEEEEESPQGLFLSLLSWLSSHMISKRGLMITLGGFEPPQGNIADVQDSYMYLGILQANTYMKEGRSCKVSWLVRTRSEPPVFRYPAGMKPQISEQGSSSPHPSTSSTSRLIINRILWQSTNRRRRPKCLKSQSQTIVTSGTRNTRSLRNSKRRKRSWKGWGE